MTKLHLIVENRRARNYHDHQKYLQANRLPKESKHGPWMLGRLRTLVLESPKPDGRSRIQWRSEAIACGEMPH